MTGPEISVVISYCHLPRHLVVSLDFTFAEGTNVCLEFDALPDHILIVQYICGAVGRMCSIGSHKRHCPFYRNPSAKKPGCRGELLPSHQCNEL